MGRYTSIDQQQINLQLCSFSLHLLRERHKVAPVRAIILLLKVAFKPAMRIGRLHEVDLTPLELSGWAICSTLSIRLHATNNALVGGEISWAITVVARHGMSDCQRRHGKGLEQVLNHHGGWPWINEDGDM